MFAVFLLLICFQLVWGSPLENYKKDLRPPCPCAREKSFVRKIVGGEPAGQDAFPFATNLVRTRHEIPFCGGNLITDRHILTAAHCVYNKRPDKFLVDVGDYDLRYTKDEQYIPVRNFTVHSRFKKSNFFNDIAIIELKSPVAFTNATKTVPLPEPDLKVKPGTTVITYGWGWLNVDTQEVPVKLQAVKVPVVDSEECGRKFGAKIVDTMICAGGEEGKDSCHGDSGSGLVEQRNNQYVLVGIVSKGKSCGKHGMPAVYTRVTSFTEWILDNTRLAGCKPCFYDE